MEKIGTSSDSSGVDGEEMLSCSDMAWSKEVAEGLKAIDLFDKIDSSKDNTILTGVVGTPNVDPMHLKYLNFVSRIFVTSHGIQGASFGIHEWTFEFLEYSDEPAAFGVRFDEKPIAIH